MKALNEKYRRDIHNVNLPEWGLLKEITVSEIAKRGEAMQPGTLLREILREVHTIWKRRGRLPWSGDGTKSKRTTGAGNK